MAERQQRQRKQQGQRPIELLYEREQLGARNSTPGAETVPLPTGQERVTLDLELHYDDLVLGTYRDAQNKGIVSQEKETAQATLEKKVVPGGE